MTTQLRPPNFPLNGQQEELLKVYGSAKASLKRLMPEPPTEEVPTKRPAVVYSTSMPSCKNPYQSSSPAPQILPTESKAVLPEGLHKKSEQSPRVARQSAEAIRVPDSSPSPFCNINAYLHYIHRIQQNQIPNFAGLGNSNLRRQTIGPCTVSADVAQHMARVRAANALRPPTGFAPSQFVTNLNSLQHLLMGQVTSPLTMPTVLGGTPTTQPPHTRLYSAPCFEGPEGPLFQNFLEAVRKSEAQMARAFGGNCSWPNSLQKFIFGFVAANAILLGIIIRMYPNDWLYVILQLVIPLLVWETLLFFVVAPEEVLTDLLGEKSSVSSNSISSPVRSTMTRGGRVHSYGDF
ncbi:unnamed protein product [Caenorhabditis auriculariae]|uniref:Uncharacterized protein n=1 Tax=Caenorhabditis auriculariae TaxID=2777116 RepID=A0A8S1H501_9PELO|nr:unnamed protein product [Caenorhabditis auriculariae]